MKMQSRPTFFAPIALLSFFVSAMAAVLPACKEGRVIPRGDGGMPTDARADVPVPGPDGQAPDGQAPDTDTPDVPPDPQCPNGQHLCANMCVPNNDVRTCGVSCSACDLVPDGTATCDGTSCGGSCPVGKMLCRGSCIDVGAACAATCPTGTHACGGQCPSNQSLNACGTSCDPCPVPSGASQATCDGTRCDFQCLNGYHRCGDRCARDDDASACGTACTACPGDPAGAGVGQCVGGICSLRCNTGFHACNGRCASDTSPSSCGTSCDPCATPTGGTASCESGGRCGGTCTGGQKLCRGVCVDATASCAGECPAGTHDCGGSCASNISPNSCGTTACAPCPRPTGASDVSCNGTTCDFTCGSGYHRCGTTCRADNDAAGCGANCTACPSDPNGAPICVGGSCALRCNTGFHVCGQRCVSNNDLATCGPMACDACQIPTGGTVTCDGLGCVASCPTAGTKLCSGACIPTAMACNGMCPTGTHVCSGNCLSNTSPASCGARCSACPDPPSHGVADCVGGTCGVRCDANYKNCPVTSLCVLTTGCCASTECTTGGTGTIGTCTAANTCSYSCNPATHKMCGSVCIPLASCCTSPDCPATSPICNTTTRLCEKRADGAACTTQSECMSGTCLTCTQDGDADTYGNKWVAPTGQFCGVCPAGSVNDSRDCHDGNVTVNPGAAFTASTYTPHPMDPDQTPNRWDWNCSGVVERQNTGTVGSVPQGCAPGGTCANACPSNPSATVAANQTCGAYTTGTACAAVCPAPPAPQSCMPVSVNTYRQLCR